MTRNEAEEFYQLYRFSYVVTIGKKFFIDSYVNEFPTIPLNIIIAAFNHWKKSDKSTFPPTLMEIKEQLWRIKLVASANLFDDDLNRKYNEELAGTTVDYYDEILGSRTTYTHKFKEILTKEEREELQTVINTIVKDLGAFNTQYER